MPLRKLLYIFLGTGALMALLLVWLPGRFLTGDGPCHLYNAQVLLDMWQHRHTAFYGGFYRVVFAPNPNWLSHILLAVPLTVFNGAVAELLFVTFYAVVCATGLYLLLKKIGGEPSYWLLAIFIFIFHHALAKGFYNFSLATAFYSWMVWSWLRFLEKKSTLNTLLFFCFTALIFFTQLLPFVFGMLTCLLLIISFTVAGEYKGIHRPFIFFGKNIAGLGLLSAPFILLLLWFTNKEGGLNIHFTFNAWQMVELVRFNYLACASETEYFFAAISGMSIITLFCAGIFLRFRPGFTLHKYDGFAMALVFTVLVYLVFPEEFMGRIILMTMRVQLFVYLLLVICIGYMLPRRLKNVGGGILFLCFTGLSVARYTYLMPAADGVADIVSASPFIKPCSVVLPLDFAPEGRDRCGKPIAGCNYLFSHATQYMGTEKPLIFLDNYEANTGYFPLVWLENTSPYTFLSRFDGIEGHPPGANIEAYEETSGKRIDYILLWCYNATFLNNEHYRQLDEQIKQRYHLVYTSTTGRTLLYGRN